MVNIKFISMVISEMEQKRKGRMVGEKGDIGKCPHVAFTIFVVFFLKLVMCVKVFAILIPVAIYIFEIVHKNKEN